MGLLDGTVSEDEDLQNMSPYDALKLRASYYPAVSEEQAAQNGAGNLQDVARMIPGISNALSLQDAFKSSGDAGDALLKGNWMDALRNYGWMGVGLLGALTGRAGGSAPVEGASSRMGVFVPAEEGKATKIARDMKGNLSSPATDTAVRRNTGLFFEPGGKPLSEISDIPMAVKPDNFQPGAYGPLSDFIEHPELFERYPDLAKTPSIITSRVEGPHGRPSFRTLDTGDGGLMPLDSLSMSAAGDPAQTKAGIAKLLQYKISTAEGLPPSVRHSYDGIKQQLQAGLEGIPEGNFPPEQLSAYHDMLNNSIQRMKDTVAKRSAEIQAVEPGASLSPASKDAAILAGNLNAGNVMAHQVGLRAVRNEEHSAATFPLAYRGTIGAKQGLRLNPDLSVLPPSNEMGPEEFRKFLADWYSYGSGLPLKGTK